MALIKTTQDEPHLTAQEAARIHQAHNPLLTPDEQIAAQFEQLLHGEVLEAARRTTFLDLHVQPEQVVRLAFEFHRIGYRVTYQLLDDEPTGQLRVTWPEAPDPPGDTRLVPLPREVQTFTPWRRVLRLLRIR
ncbi:hypothetical protein [Deinococcus radiotolerans]|uniref:Uncharacterized protein n=1 Tax=Deinococcus radiotolerans TaxID=1309407 RepID=A0ABQ2FQE5_9DEIO|nr:hypothetical protein [Deinococcus radiotolerans]GGL16628.1 hypothetical protein GCM10010844_39440 [Deinococcus radiotolerans]